MKTAKTTKAKESGEKAPAFDKKEILEAAKGIASSRKICSNCLGRQFAHVSTGMTNRQRGEILRGLLKDKEPATCEVCVNLFKKLGDHASAAEKKVKGYEFSTFAVGTKLSGDLIVREEALWEEAGIEYCESIRSELNREVGKLVYDRIRKEVDEKKPDMLIIINLEKDRIELQIASIFIRGGYRKLVRGIPQTKWDMYTVTVEDVIAGPFMKATGGTGHALHASGREDIDAKCLDWRPFVLEIKEPKKRAVDLRKMKALIKKTKKAEVDGLVFAGKDEVVEVKSQRLDKSYRALVSFSKPVKAADLAKLAKLKGIVRQQTPTRVAHRRADKVRRRRVKSVSWERVNNKSIELQIKGEAGLYIKELVSGDNGRTTPSVAGLLDNPAVVIELDVIRIWK